MFVHYNNIPMVLNNKWPIFSYVKQPSVSSVYYHFVYTLCKYSLWTTYLNIIYVIILLRYILATESVIKSTSRISIERLIGTIILHLFYVLLCSSKWQIRVNLCYRFDPMDCWYFLKISIFMHGALHRFVNVFYFGSVVEIDWRIKLSQQVTFWKVSIVQNYEFTGYPRWFVLQTILLLMYLYWYSFCRIFQFHFFFKEKTEQGSCNNNSHFTCSKHTTNSLSII